MAIFFSVPRFSNGDVLGVPFSFGEEESSVPVFFLN